MEMADGLEGPRGRDEFDLFFFFGLFVSFQMTGMVLQLLGTYPRVEGLWLCGKNLQQVSKVGK